MGDVINSVQPAEEIAWPGATLETGTGFEGTFRKEYPRVVAVLTRLTGDRAQSEELAADAFCKLSRRPVPADSDQMLAWLYRVAINAGLDAVRSNGRRRRREQQAGSEEAHSAPARALDDLLRQERCARVRSVLANLKPRDAELLLLRSDGMAYKDLAAVANVQPNSVGQLLARAEAEFEKKYRARYGDAL